MVLLANAHIVGLDDPKALSPDKAVITFRVLGAETATYRIARLLWSSMPHVLDTTILKLDDYPPRASRCSIAARRPLLHTEPPPQTYDIFRETKLAA